MKTVSGTLAALALATAGLVAPTMIAPAAAAVDNSDPQRFVETLTTDGFAAMRTGDKAGAKSRFRALLAQNVAVDEVGARLIRRWLPTISPAQKAAYDSALPAYIVGTYTDRLFEYANATVKVIRTQPTAGDGVDVYSTVTKPGAQPIPAVWSVTKVGGGYKVLNLRVGGINVAMAQAADFDSVIQRQGFDALVKMMKARG
ncbi:MlaC/ttg2D family ABC transporter substrate-binding protein [Sphingomonas nostoxanthinifaciens]|uniref:MlaC/ttg2D family ABC transporter substrate-binding protein n=1 Tax=Sphingomonas nostoxanthinifaciens TaxID=2872652 RepID=UPI001CC205A1|nr:ABC transporter substrate-binding protein [Sphingomonas nostoxanthinifaciens]UAK23885.1 ABC transporter substrate-binding protein [Sphingomonas nostoxanthinifaciens]